MLSKYLTILAAAGAAMGAPGAPGYHQGGGYQGGGSQGDGYQGGGYQGGGYHDGVVTAPSGDKPNGYAPTTTTYKSPDGVASALANTATESLSIAAAQATAKTLSPTSKVKGKVFDRIIQIYLETTAYNNTIADRTTLHDTPF